MMKRELSDILENCIKLMDAGLPMEGCLERYPKYSPELKNLLDTAQHINGLRVENIPSNAMDQSRIKLLLLAKRLRDENVAESGDGLSDWFVKFRVRTMQSLSFLRPFAGRMALALGIAVVFILFSGGLLITSAKSLPGDSLYPLKRAVEDIKISLAPNGEVRHDYEDAYSQQRVEEVQKLVGLAREQQISFEGLITSMDGSQWNVSGIRVIIQPDTMFIAGPNGVDSIFAGMEVEIEGNTSSQGWVLADEIHLREFQVNGIVEEINAHKWQISGMPLQITASSQIDPGIRVGDQVAVLVRSDDSGKFALAILRELHPYATYAPFRSDEDNPTMNGESTIESNKVQNRVGILEQVSENYWKINGEYYYLVGNTIIDEDIKVGDPISVRYISEANGSYTAIKIELSEDSNRSEGSSTEETPVDKDKTEEHDSDDGTPTEEEKESTKMPEQTKTPEPTDDH